MSHNNNANNINGSSKAGYLRARRAWRCSLLVIVHKCSHEPAGWTALSCFNEMADETVCIHFFIYFLNYKRAE